MGTSSKGCSRVQLHNDFISLGLILFPARLDDNAIPWLFCMKILLPGIGPVLICQLTGGNNARCNANATVFKSLYLLSEGLKLSFKLPIHSQICFFCNHLSFSSNRDIRIVPFAGGNIVVYQLWILNNHPGGTQVIENLCNKLRSLMGCLNAYFTPLHISRSLKILLYMTNTLDA